MNTNDTSLFGGKPYPDWQGSDFSLPGYKNAKILFTDKESNKVTQWGFLVSPSSVNIQSSNNIQKSKTMAGWIFNHLGPSIGSLTISGYFLDTLKAPERLRFWSIYTQYVEDQQDRYLEYANNWKQTIMIEGLYYDGLIESLSQSKSAQMPFLYQYTINFSFYKTRPAYSISNSSSMSESSMKNYMGITDGKTQVTPVTSRNQIKLSNGVLSVLQR